MTAANARRGEQRRMRIEQKASEIMAAKAGQTIDWPAMEQQLDGAMSRLKSSDRDALVLRFFERLSLREVGDAVGISEDAAKVRVSRAITRLRRIVGVSAPVAALAAALDANLTHAAPAALTAQLAPAALGAPATSTAAILAKGTSTVMFYAQMKIAAGVVGVMLLAGGTSVAIHQVAVADGRTVPAAPAQAAPATTQSIAATQAIAIKQDSPLACFTSIYDACVNRDVTAIRKLIYARDETEAQVADAMAEQLAAQGELNRVMQQRFGAEATNLIPPRTELTKFRQLITGPNGDKGVVTYEQMSFPVLKINGLWYADARGVFNPRGGKGPPLDRQAALARAAGQTYREVTKELEAGKYKSVAEVQQAFKVRQRTAMGAAATQPAATSKPVAAR
jgi:hypothetical protein